MSARTDKTPKLEFLCFVLLGQRNPWTIHPCDRRKALITIPSLLPFQKIQIQLLIFIKVNPPPSPPPVPPMNLEYCAVTSANGSASFFKGALCRDTWKPNSANKVHFVLSGHLETSQLGKDRRGLPCSVLSTLEVSPTFLALGPSPERPAWLCSCDSCFSKEIGGRLEGEHSFPY